VQFFKLKIYSKPCSMEPLEEHIAFSRF